MLASAFPPRWGMQWLGCVAGKPCCALSRGLGPFEAYPGPMNVTTGVVTATAPPRAPCRLFDRIERLAEVPCGGPAGSQSARFSVKPGAAIRGPKPYQQFAGLMPAHRASTAATINCNGNFTVCTEACDADSLCVGINLLGCSPEEPGSQCWLLHAAAVPSLVPNVIDHACFYGKPGAPVVPVAKPAKTWTCATQGRECR